jgi:hypothetical protein
MSIAAAKIDTIDAAWREAQAKEITELKAIIEVQRLAMIELNDRNAATAAAETEDEETLKNIIVRLESIITELQVQLQMEKDRTDTWSHHFKELDELAQENIKELEDLRLKNTQLKAWLLRLHKSKQELASSYSSDMRTLRAIEERYMATYAQHIRNTPLPE